MWDSSGAAGLRVPEADAVAPLALQAAVALHGEPAFAVAADARVLAANGRAERELGARAGLATVHDLLAESEETVRDLLGRVLATTTPVAVTLTLRCERGLERRRLRGAAIAGRGAPEVGLLVVEEPEGEPVGEDGLRRRAEDLARLNRQLAEAKQRAEEANRSKTEFLARVSHELRTPLNAIIGFSEIMAQGMFGPVMPERYGVYARDILTSGRHLLDLVNDVLDLSKVEAGKMTLREQTIDVAALVARVLRLVEEPARAKGLVLETGFAPALPLLFADPRAVTQMLLNLLSNAVKFTLAGGRIRIVVGEAGGGLAIQVEDTGIGIAPENIGRCLEPFDQIDNVLTRRFEGSGLGLAITKALAEMHQGALRLESRIGTGTTACLIFPPGRSRRLPSGAEAP